ncbi:MAG: helix-turn-helix transcriptional regulator [Oscillospiraceae bacterium]|nr:helix-turn-helix transcriptional regulator [Oscillospiraceae bacterium]
MNYYEIGQRIRKHRKQKGLSQEQLAEAVNISVTHMSHIETGNTKLSLPVLVAVAVVLQVTTDDLLHDQDDDTAAAMNNVMAVLKECSLPQLKIIADLARSVHRNTPDLNK